MVTVDELTRQSLEILRPHPNPISQISNVVRGVLDANGITGRNLDLEKTLSTVTQMVFEQLLEPADVSAENLGIQTVNVDWPKEEPKPERKPRQKKSKPPVPAETEETDDESLEVHRGREGSDWLSRYYGN